MTDADGFWRDAKTLSDAGREAEAEEACRRGLASAPAHVGLLKILASLTKIRLDLPGALALYDRVAELAPDDAAGRLHRAMAMLLAGDWERGFDEYRWRWKAPGFASPDFGAGSPRWRGEDLDGTLMVFAEQGFGDTLHFARYLPLAARRCRRLVIVCPPELERLIAGVEGVAECISGGTVPPCAAAAPLLDLPAIFATTPEAVPGTVPYLKAPSATNPDAPLPRVGLVWRGGADYATDGKRSPGLVAFEAIRAVEGVDFVALQKGMPDEERAALGDLPCPGDGFRDFADTAAAIAGLDLVISVDTAVAHLAGAMGKPVWILLAHMPDWRWLTGREDTPWYPTARLFRQSVPGDWTTPIAKVAAELGEITSRVP